MRNIELECMTLWRYCGVLAHSKRPTPANWQKNPLELKHVTTPNVGLMLGPASGGVVAVDFDGMSAWNYFDQEVNVALPKTITWTSGKVGRCQMAFAVPEQYWSVLKTRKITTAQSDLIAEGEGFELRWTGGQSVLPPSIHPDTNEPYVWLTAPSEGDYAEIPEALLVHWLLLCNPHKEPDDTYVEPTLDTLTDERVAEVDGLLKDLKQRFHNLSYDDWRTVSWAVAKHLGREAGLALMKQYYPERQANEYRDLFKGYQAQLSPGIGSLIFLARPRRADKLFADAESRLAQARERLKRYGK